MNHILFLLLSCALLPAAALEYSNVQPAQSSVGYLIKQMGVPSEGSFKKFSAQIVFDPDRMERSQARVEIDIASIDTGMAEADAEVATPGWFDSKRFPSASFVSSGLKKLDASRLQATGKLTIKGKTRDISVPFSYRPQGNALMLEGAFSIRRSEFGIGSGVWADPSVVADDVEIRFRFLVAPPTNQPTKKGK